MGKEVALEIVGVIVIVIAIILLIVNLMFCVVGFHDPIDSLVSVTYCVILFLAGSVLYGIDKKPDDAYRCSSLGGVYGNEKCFYGGEAKSIDEIKESVGL